MQVGQCGAHIQSRIGRSAGNSDARFTCVPAADVLDRHVGQRLDHLGRGRSVAAGADGSGSVAGASDEAGADVGDVASDQPRAAVVEAAETRCRRRAGRRGRRRRPRYCRRRRTRRRSGWLTRRARRDDGACSSNAQRPVGGFPTRLHREIRYSWTSSIRVPKLPLGWMKATVVPRDPGRGSVSIARAPAATTAASASRTSSTR